MSYLKINKLLQLYVQSHHTFVTKYGHTTVYFHYIKLMNFANGCNRWELILKSNNKQCLMSKLTVSLLNYNFIINFDTVDC